LAAGIGARLLKLGGGRAGRLRSLPFAGGWTTHRDMPAPEGGTFQQLWAERPRR
jgi:L-lactate dehydrogenase complex protein LldF